MENSVVKTKRTRVAKGLLIANSVKKIVNSMIVYYNPNNYRVIRNYGE